MFGRPYDEEGRPIIIKSDEDLAAEAMFKDETECPECGSDNVAWGCAFLKHKNMSIRHNGGE